MIYIGCDPGKTGSMAIIWHTGDVEVIPFDKTAYINAIARANEAGECKCCLEHVSSMPKQGVASTFNFGENFGWIQGILDAYGVPYELVRPQKWKKEFSVTADKNSSIAVCKRLFPDVSLLRTENCRKDDDGMAEALLLAEYARRRL
jgi:crossover junction endodeoxyribonuclease RuvC